jgi:16S rRNA (guanine966-N2)-methyltransferase
MPDSISLRITGGKYRGRWLTSPVNKQLRPTRDVVREALFNMLHALMDLEDLTAYDLFCGSGALGLEALSRGAKHVTFVDREIRPVQGNLKALEIPEEQFTLYRRNAFTYKPKERPDIIFADPPYDVEFGRKLLELHKTLGQSGTIWAVETEAPERLDKFMEKELPGVFTIVRDKTHGTNRLWILEQN